MTIHFWSIGKSHDVHIKQGVEDFTQRISRYYKVKWNIIQPPKKRRADERDRIAKKRRGKYS